ncbi:MAG: tetratricopeptide repeat protein [Halioglobus sp.]|nr:tetratricopeptide repeat protein [Halioglobus sp.]
MRALLYAAPLLLTACGGLGRMFEEPLPTLADLEPVTAPTSAAALPLLSHAELAALYRQVLTRQQDEQTRLGILHRLADIEMLGAEARLLEGEQRDAFFDQAIAAYRQLLQEYPDYPRRDRIQYQLSRAYDLSGRPEQSMRTLEQMSTSAAGSVHLPEVHFRRAERYFSGGDYGAAENTYGEVIAYGAQTPFFTRALYMQGWSRFKQHRYDSAVEAITYSLDQLLSDGRRVDALPRSDQELATDSLRVLALAFNHLGGAGQVTAAYQRLGDRHYLHSIYGALGELYLSQERYRDSAGAFGAFIEQHPDSAHAHRFQVYAIEALEAGGFRELILQAKQDYVARYVPTGAYWQGADAAAQGGMAEKLRVYMRELASHYHATAQAAQDAAEQANAGSEDFARAAGYYRLYLQSFPGDPDAAELTFLLAESLFEAADYAGAAAAYEQVAYSFQGYARAADAGYSAILAHRELAAARPDQAEPALGRARIDTQLRFFDDFPLDARAPTVMLNTASELLQAGDYPGAAGAASALTAREPAVPAEVLAPAWLVIGHSMSALQDHTRAEEAYRQGLAQMPADDERRADTIERLATAIYRAGESESDKGNHLAAAAQFERILATAPASAVSVNAQYDAAGAYIRAGDLAQANALLVDFRERYPEHALSAGIGKLLIGNYEQTEQWRDAAVELQRLAATGADDAVSRQATLLAAEYYERSGDTQSAIARYRDHAGAWQQPLDEHVEVLNRLAGLYAATGNEEKRRYWLNRMVLAHDGAGSSATPRSAYLAANSTSVLAAQAYAVYDATALAQPLQQSLAAKKAAMERALELYRKCLDYGVEEFSTLSNYRIARIYQQFSEALLGSPRPASLDALALEQYDIMLEEQAYPFEEQAIAAHAQNAQRSWDGVYDQWVQGSFAELARLLPARYDKTETMDIAQSEGLGGFFGNRAGRKIQRLNEEALERRREGDFDGAEAAYQSALAVDEEQALTHRNLGILYDLYRGMPDKALHHYTRYQALQPANERVVAGWIADLQRRRPGLAKEAI